MRFILPYIDYLIVKIHSWYPQECCSGNDCKPVPCGDILPIEGGYMWNGLTFLNKIVKSSPDGLCHVCHLGERTFCLFLPLGLS